MRKTIFVALSFIFLLLSAISCFASTLETDYIKDNTVLFIQANGNQLYKFITETLIEALNSKVSSEKEQAMDAVKKWIDAGFDSLKNKSSSEIAEMLKDWNQNGYFIPNGAIKFAFYNDNTTYLSLAAKTDLKRLFEASKNYAKEQDLSVKETHDTVSFVHKNGTETKFTSTDVSQGCVSPNGKSINKQLNIQKILNQEDALVVSEVDFDLINKQEQAAEDKISWVENNAIYKAIHPIYRDFHKLRLIVKSNQTHLVASYKDENVRQAHKKALGIIKDEFEGAEEIVLARAKENGVENNLKINLKMKIIDKAPWLGIEIGSIVELNKYIAMFPLILLHEQEIYKDMHRQECDSRLNIELNRDKVKPIGWRTLFERKKVELNKNIAYAMACFDKLAEETNKFVKEYKDVPDEEKLDEYINLIHDFDKNLPWEFLKNFEWDEEKELFTRETRIVFTTILRRNFGMFIASVAKQFMEKYPDKDCSFTLSAILKSFIMFEYSSSIRSGYSTAVGTLAKCVYYYDRIIDNKFSKEEMSELLKIINQYEKHRRSFIEIIKAYYNNYYSVTLGDAYMYVPISSIFGHFIGGSPYLVDEKALVEYEKGNYYEGDTIIEEYYGTKNIYGIYGLINSKEVVGYKDRARMALMKAWLEHKLGLPVTAIDPLTNKQVSYQAATKDEPEYFYCEDKYSYPYKKLTYFDSLGTKEERKKREQTMREYNAKQREKMKNKQ